jgi:cytochrome c-type biogenesis protein CcmH/NrfG
VNSLSYLADVQFLQQRYDAAAVTYHNLLEVRTRLSGTAHPQTLFVMGALAWALHKQGRRRSAVELTVRCAALSSQSL